MKQSKDKVTNAKIVRIAWSRGEFDVLWHADFSPEQSPEGYGELPDGDKQA